MLGFGNTGQGLTRGLARFIAGTFSEVNSVARGKIVKGRKKEKEEKRNKKEKPSKKLTAHFLNTPYKV